MNYRTIYLDCDGVVLDSNGVKIEAFREAMSGYSPDHVDTFIDYHKSIGGVSRYKKFEYFLRAIVGDYSQEAYERLIEDFGAGCRKKLMAAELTEGCEEFLSLFSGARKPAIISGGDQEEIRSVFAERGLSGHFSAIYGSPTTKDEHFENLLLKEGAEAPVLYIGDSAIDHQVARRFSVDFIFLSNYTDLVDWQTYCAENDLTRFRTFTDLLRAWGKQPDTA